MSTIIEKAYPFPLKNISLANDIDLAYMDEGVGPYTLLFIHGLGSYAPAWNKNISILTEDFRCVAIDLPNYGQSKKGEYPFSMTFFAETLEALIRKLGLKRVVLVGHSMGGQIAMTMALRKTTPFEKLILIAPAGFETFNGMHRMWFQQMFSSRVIKSFSSETIMQNFEWNFSTRKLPGDATFMFGDRIRLKQKPQEYEWYCKMISRSVKSMLDEPVFDRLSEIEQPTLALFGNQDYLIPNRMLNPTMTPQAVAKKGQRQIPNCELQLFSPCGHFVQWECAERVNGAIWDFLGT